jgi:hypothetical protein
VSNPANSCAWCRAAVDPHSWTAKPDFAACAVTTSPDRSYDICVDGTCVSPGCGDPTCNVSGPGFPLPETNQRSCYDAVAAIACPGTAGSASCGTTAFCGQDAQYGWDTAHPAAERFVRSEPVAGEPVVVDEVTGLAWQGCAAGLSGSARDAGTAATLGWWEALARCEGLVWAGHADWYLPDVKELSSIVDHRRGEPTIDVAVFPGVPDAAFWSSSSAAAAPSAAWNVRFDIGSGAASDKSTGGAIRCARRR